jgi:hypothetical protein
MSRDQYSQTNQRILEGAFVGVSFYLAYLIRYGGALLPYQFGVTLIPAKGVQRYRLDKGRVAKASLRNLRSYLCQVVR